jgi:hypothetical protein
MIVESGEIRSEINTMRAWVTNVCPSYDQWLDPPDFKHGYGVDHEFDIEEALSKSCTLCMAILDDKIEEGAICGKHPYSLCELGVCEGCQPN